MKKIAIIGAGGFGREVKVIIDALNKEEEVYEFIGFFDDAREKGEIINKYPVLGGIDELNAHSENLAIVIAVGDPTTKKKIVEGITNKWISFPNIISPKADISDEFILLGKGNIICSGVIITCNIEIKDFVILNLMCTVGHDTVINSYSSFMPSVNISGEVEIQEGAYIGTGAKIINQLEIGEFTTVGAGAVVIRNIPDYAVVVGNPGKIIRINEKEVIKNE